MKIYTRTGDTGSTALVGGSRVSKASARLEAYGTVDELNSHLGLLLALDIPAPLSETLTTVQNRLFDLGAYLATPPEKETPASRLQALDIMASDLEKAIDAMDADLQPLSCFILPGGAITGATANVARAVCRRAERRVIALGNTDPVAPQAIRLLNRLSDYLFTAARYLNHLASRPETPWSPSKL